MELLSHICCRMPELHSAWRELSGVRLYTPVAQFSKKNILNLCQKTEKENAGFRAGSFLEREIYFGPIK